MKVYIVYDCDEWKTKDSFRFLAVCDRAHLDTMLEAIKADHEYTDDEMKTYIYIEETTLNTYHYIFPNEQ